MAPHPHHDRRPATGDIGRHYGAARVRLTDLLATAGDDEWATPVPACPGWDVKAVVSHLVGTVEDALAGRLTGPPPPEVTAVQVERHRATPPATLLATWDELGPSFEELVTALDVFAAALDAGSHEHDVRGALGRPGGRDSELVREGARRLVAGLDCGAPVAFAVPDVGPGVVFANEAADALGPDAGDAVLRAETTAFELFRLRLGRRSRAQALALPWSRDPGDVVDRLFVFGPAESPIVE